MSAKAIDISGLRFGRLVVRCRTKGHSNDSSVFWLCVCDCGVEKAVSGSRLRSGDTKSCGCLRLEKLRRLAPMASFKHGLSYSREYRVWAVAKDRCGNAKNFNYKDYGGRGIKMCASWRNSFESFYEDMGPCPPGLTLERKDNNKGYVIGNCKWATRKEQANNRRNSRLLEEA